MKIRLILFSILLPLLSFAGSRSGIVIVSATYNYMSDNKNESIAQAEQKALDRAKIKALEEKFGVDTSSVSSTVLRNSQSNKETVTESDFYSMGLSSVQGEWIETLNEEVGEPSYKDGFLCLTARVKGKARAKNTASIEIETTVLRNGTDNINSNDKFKSGDKIYLQFSTPVEGYVCVYLVDEENTAYCLLPYQYNTTGCHKVKANEEYIFFSEKYSSPDEQVDEYELTTTHSLEQDQIWIVFSPNTFYKANDDKTANNWLEQPMPRSLTYKEFMQWLAHNRMHDEQMVVKRDLITIIK